MKKTKNNATMLLPPHSQKTLQTQISHQKPVTPRLGPFGASVGSCGAPCGGSGTRRVAGGLRPFGAIPTSGGDDCLTSGNATFIYLNIQKQNIYIYTQIYINMYIYIDTYYVCSFSLKWRMPVMKYLLKNEELRNCDCVSKNKKTTPSWNSDGWQLWF